MMMMLGRGTAPVHIDVGGVIYTSSLEILTRFPESKLARMFNGSIPIVLDSLKQHYFIDRDGKMFRHILNYLRSAKLILPDNFNEIEQLWEEAKYYDLTSMVKDVELYRKSKQKIVVKKEEKEYCDCIAISISPDLGERITLSAERALLEEVFPELSSALMDSRNSGWNMENRYVIRFPLNGFCKLNSVQVLQRLLNQGFKLIAATGGGVEGQQFSEYLFCKDCKAAA
ncbi:BTB/POZ domain-containing protein kctd15 [Octopus bimaculoides]|uniref:BTB/POZ domain-containing protein kctd15 n=1 Tax=Octopus bimaculoides TaxID=37653 RepID=UPI00071D6EB8|nr:BTB/POZ domain-containing protein kctd15 [Octopus bimaculoides]|eukprot:XP_014768024.1 PREDICTED: BTB/POZ domain-containing protein kctd15-like [Octopus bimaculoides]